MVSPVPMPMRVRDIPAHHAEGLRNIHALATESARLRQLTNTAEGSVGQRLGRQQEVDRTDRERGLLEISVRGSGVPTEWVDLARRLGFSRQPWTAEQILPLPAPLPPARGTRHRVASDTHLLADMAAVSATRAHLLSHHRISTDPNSPAEHQFRRNMQTVWQRAVVTAAGISLSTSQRQRIADSAAIDLDQHLSVYRDLSLEDIDTLWHAYTGTAFGDSARRKLTKTPARDTTTPPVLPAPEYWLDHARSRLASAAPADPDVEIAAAVTAAVPDHDLPADRDPALQPDPFDTVCLDLHSANGPDP
ncbi:hypothetical protein ACTD5D_09980 [Nocardia takedensis]|uniref:hypothetical protein n=1 Tax=Nocardia takedensis TaxID=259390 RepID=UPI003F75DB9C